MGQCVVLWEVDEGGQGGSLGERLRGIWWMLPLVRELDAHLLVRWEINDECPCRFEELFESGVVSVYHRASTPRDLQRLAPILIWRSSFKALPMDPLRAFSSKHMSLIPYIGNYDQAVRECLHLLTPVEPIRRRVQALEAMGLGPSTIGVYVGHCLTKNEELFDALLTQVPLQRRAGPSVFMPGAAREVGRWWRKRLSNHGIDVLTTEEPLETGQTAAAADTAGMTLVVDTLCMAECETVLKTCPSSLMTISDWLAGREEIRLSDNVLLSERVAKTVSPTDRFGFLRVVSGLIHVGANIGQERDLYHRHGVSVLWIEPIPRVFRELRQRLAGFPRQKAFQALITDADDREECFHIANNGGASSSLLALHEHRDIWPSVEFVETIRLRSSTLESLLRDAHVDVSRYDALVLDTQGTELLVLRGAKSLLPNFRFILSEVADFEAYVGCCREQELAAFLAQCGFCEYSRHLQAERSGGGHYFEIVYERRNHGMLTQRKCTP